MGIIKRPFWLNNDYGSFGTLNGDMEADIAVIGGGITGVSAAFHLAEAGADFVLLEKDRIGSGATGHSMGGLVPGIEQEDIWQSVEKYGEDRTKTIWRVSGNAIDEIASLCSKKGIKCDFVRGPALDLVEDRKELGLLDYEHKAAGRCGVETEIIEEGRLRGEVAVGKSVVGALEYKNCAQLNPAAFVNGLAIAIKGHAERLFQGTEVNKIENDDGSFTITTGKGRLKANKLILATESYTPQLGILKKRMATVRINALATERLDPDLMEKLGFRDKLAWNLGRDYNFIRTTADNRVIIDGGDSLSKAEGDMPQQKRIMEIHERLIELFPSLSGQGIEFEWSGRMAAPIRYVPGLNEGIKAISRIADIRLNLPLVGQIGARMISMPFLGHVKNNPNMFYSAGYIGHGLPLGFLGGKVLSELSVGSPGDESIELLNAYDPENRL
jgi:gamma-glutamylputrescine oxidase